jgi:hypothetical protein
MSTRHPAAIALVVVDALEVRALVGYSRTSSLSVAATGEDGIQA